MPTKYSDSVKGDKGNHNQDARFDLSGGYLGVTQWDGDKVTDRVLLTPKQVTEMAAFVEANKARR